LLQLLLLPQLFASPLTAPIAPLSLQLLLLPQLLASPLTAPIAALSLLQHAAPFEHAPLVVPMLPVSLLLLAQPTKAKAATATKPVKANLRIENS
jgi:hypothetical protein